MVKLCLHDARQGIEGAKENTREQQNRIAAKPLVNMLGLCRSYYADLRSRREGAVLHTRALRATVQR